MKIIAIGDPHFKIDNIPIVDKFILRVGVIVKKEKPDYVIVMGDLLHTHERIHTIPMNKAYEFIEMLSSITKTIVLVGNHDMISNTQFLNENHWMNGMKKWRNVTIVDKVTHISTHISTHSGDNVFHFVCCPYVFAGRFIEALNTSEKDWKDADCIFAHQEFFGCKMGALISENGDKWDEKLPNVVSGHIHSNQTINNIYYCGAPIQNAFGDTNDNTISILEWTSPHKKYELREIDLNLPKKHLVYTDMDNISNITLPTNGDIVKITVGGSYDEFKSFKKTKQYKEIAKTGNKIVFKPKKKEIESDKKTIDDIRGNLRSNLRGNLRGNKESEGENNFASVLKNLLENEENGYLLDLFETIIMNRE